MDWKETPDAHFFMFDLPGQTKNDVKLQVHQGRVLHVSADRKLGQDEDEKYVKWHCRERASNESLCREFRLPENDLVDQITASMRDGVLIVTVPKDRYKKKKRRKKHVEIASEEEFLSSEHHKGIGRFVCCKA